MYAILDGKSNKDPSSVINVANFYQQGRPVPLFAYEIHGTGDNLWTFDLRSWNSTQSSIPLELYPTLQSILLDLTHNTLNGTCTVPTSSAGSNITTLNCMSGTLDPGDFLYFNITSSHILNNTYDLPGSSSSTVILRTEDNQWASGQNPPTLILKSVDPSSRTLEETVLRTNVANPIDCTQLKVCLSGTTSGSPVGAEVMAPLGLLLSKQANRSLTCSTNSPSAVY